MMHAVYLELYNVVLEVFKKKTAWIICRFC